jgi:hypothetical protein
MDWEEGKIKMKEITRKEEKRRKNMRKGARQEEEKATDYPAHYDVTPLLAVRLNWWPIYKATHS